MAWRKTSHQTYFLYGIACVVIMYICIVGLRTLSSSALFMRPDRLNVGFYGDEAIVLSFGLTDEVNYVVSLSHEEKITIPGGYGQYPFGSLGKLVALQKDSDIMQRAFSSLLSTYVHYYVMPKNPEVYQKPDTQDPKYSRIALISSLFSGEYRANMNIFDKCYIAYLIARRRPQEYVVLRSTIKRDKDDGTRLFSEKNFQKKYKGFFYYQSIREESLEVQIKYSNYKSATTLSRIIEGQGIRVVDLSPNEANIAKCYIKTSSGEKSNTARFLSTILHCPVKKADTEGVDIIIYLGSELEKIWE